MRVGLLYIQARVYVQIEPHYKIQFYLLYLGQQKYYKYTRTDIVRLKVTKIKCYISLRKIQDCP